MGCCGDNTTPGSPVDQKALAEKIMASLPVAVHGYTATDRHQLQGLQMLMPPEDGKDRQFLRPVFHPDGSIEYPDTEGPSVPRDINGYIRDEANPYLFHPLWGECTKRMQGLQHDPHTGEVEVKMVCGHQDSPHKMKFISAVQCSECPLRELPKRKNPAQPGS